MGSLGRKMQRQRTSGLRDRTPEELHDFTTHVLDNDGQDLAWLSWQGYQKAGRGVVVWVDPAEAPCIYVDEHKLDMLRQLPFYNIDAVRQAVATYEPTLQYVLLIKMPRTATLYENVRLSVVPGYSPPTAHIDPMKLTRFSERGH